MKKLLAFAILFFVFSAKPLLAQTTNITLQVTDTGSQAWFGGTWFVTLVTPPGATPFGPPFYNLGTTTPVPNQSQVGVLSGTGSATMTLTQNLQISPTNSQWKFVVCPQVTGSTCFTQFIVITPTTTVTLTPAPPVANAGPGVVAYLDSEINASIGQTYYNLTNAILRVCQTSTGTSCTLWANSGGSGLPAGVVGGTNPLLSLTQSANGADTLNASRFTDTSPTGTFLNFMNAAKNATLFSVDVLGNVTANSYQTNGAGAGYFQCSNGNGTLPTLVAGAAQISCPSGAITNYQLLLPTAAATGCLNGANAANVVTLSFVACGATSLSSLTAAGAANTINNLNFPQTWNCAMTTDAQDCIAFGESAAATGGTLTGGLANQAIVSASTASNSTATPLEVAQGSITNTVATPLAQFEATWNNAALVGTGVVVNVTNTASAAASAPFEVNIGGTPQLAVDKSGIVNFNSIATVTSVPPNLPGGAGAFGWKYCIDGNSYCTGFTGQEEYHLVQVSGNGWFGVGAAAPSGSSSALAPDTASGTALSNGGVAGALYTKNGTCSTFVGITGGSYLCHDTTAHELLATTNGSSSFGMINRSQPGAINSTDQTAAITTATLCAAAAGACNVAGQYEVHFDFIETGTACGTPGTGGVTFLLTWTDANGTAHTAVSLGMDDASAINAVSQTFHFQTSLGAAWASGQFTLSSNGSVIQYATGYTACGTGTGTYRIQATVVRLQ